MRSPILQATRVREALRAEMSPKEAVYVEARMNGSNPVAAARVAGFPNPDEDSIRLETRPLIREAMKAHARVAMHRMALTRDDVLAGFLDAVNMAQTATELTGAWREIGKMIGAYEPKKIDLTIKGANAVKELSDEQLLELAAVDGEFEVLSFEDEDGDEADDVR